MLLFIDGFDHYDVGRLLLKWEIANGLGNIPAFPAGRTTGGKACQLVAQGGGGTSGALGKSYAGVQLTPTAILGVAFKPDASSSGYLIRFSDSVGVTIQMYLEWDVGTAKLKVKRGDGTLMATSIATLVPGVWCYVEFKVTFGAAGAGAFSLHVNGANDVFANSVQTRMSVNNWTDQIYIGGPYGANQPMGIVDDIYICDGTTTNNNDFLGDCVAQSLLPTGVGALTNFALTGAPTNWQAVSENPPNDDISYVSSAVVGTTDTYKFASLAAAAGSIKGIQFVLDARKDDAGTRTLAGITRQAATNYAGPNKNPGNTYAFLQNVVELNPATGLAWSVADVNADEFGIRVIA